MKPQKAKHYYLEIEKNKPHYIGKEYIVFEKHDGWYGYMDPGGQIKSRNQRVIPSLVELSKQLVGLEGRLIFEIMVAKVDEFAILNGLLNRHEVCTNAYIRVHDYLVPGNLPFNKRLNKAIDYVEELNSDVVWMANMLGTYRSPSWQSLAEEQWALGREGIVMKELRHLYAPGSRIGSLLKIKEDMTLDMLVIDVVEGEGKYEGMVGALRVFESSGQEHLVGGMTDAERAAWWDEPDLIFGSVVEIKAMKRLKNGSLREPRFKAIRFDKGIEDID